MSKNSFFHASLRKSNSKESDFLRFIEREGGFLPPSHFPRCSVAEDIASFFDSLTSLPFGAGWFFMRRSGTDNWSEASER